MLSNPPLLIMSWWWTILINVDVITCLPYLHIYTLISTPPLDCQMGHLGIETHMVSPHVGWPTLFPLCQPTRWRNSGNGRRRQYYSVVADSQSPQYWMQALLEVYSFQDSNGVWHNAYAILCIYSILYIYLSGYISCTSLLIAVILQTYCILSHDIQCVHCMYYCMRFGFYSLISW